MSELTRTFAAAFRRKGAEKLDAAELRRVLSLDLRWFAPGDAQRVVDHGVAVGLLAAPDGPQGPLEARFDLASVDVPLQFRPSHAVFDEKPIAQTAAPSAVTPAAGADAAPVAAATVPPAPAPAAAEQAASDAAGDDALDAVLDAAADAAGVERAAIDREVAQEYERRGKRLSKNVVALLIARRHGVDVAARAADLAARLRA